MITVIIIIVVILIVIVLLMSSSSSTSRIIRNPYVGSSDDIEDSTPLKDNVDAENFISDMKRDIAVGAPSGTFELPLEVDKEIQRYCMKCPDSNVRIPLSFDARNVREWKGKLSDSMDQGTCGSCWAFATVSAVSDKIRIFAVKGEHKIIPHININSPFDSYNEEQVVSHTSSSLLSDEVTVTTDNGVLRCLNILSPYYLSGCDFSKLESLVSPSVAAALKRYNNSTHCNGSPLQIGFLYILLRGVVALGCENEPLEYTCKNMDGCSLFKVKCIYRVSNDFYNAVREKDKAQIHKLLKSNEQKIQREIMMNGPVATMMVQYDNFIQKQEGRDVKGFLYFKDGSALYMQKIGRRHDAMHSIVLIGWGDVRHNGKTIKYWICRNTWAENGDKPIGKYFYILRGKNFCYIEYNVWSCQPFEVYDTSGEISEDKVGQKQSKNKIVCTDGKCMR